MTDWECTIKGIGPSHGGPIAADQMLSRVTAELADAGHHIISAVLSHNGGAGIHDLVAAPTHKAEESKVQGNEDDINPPTGDDPQSAPPAEGDVSDLTSGDDGDDEDNGEDDGDPSDQPTTDQQPEGEQPAA